MNLIDNYVGGFPLLFAGIFEIIAIIYVYGELIFTIHKNATAEILFLICISRKVTFHRTKPPKTYIKWV